MLTFLDRLRVVEQNRIPDQNRRFRWVRCPGCQRLTHIPTGRRICAGCAAKTAEEN